MYVCVRERVCVPVSAVPGPKHCGFVRSAYCDWMPSASENRTHRFTCATKVVQTPHRHTDADSAKDKETDSSLLNTMFMQHIHVHLAVDFKVS